MPKVIISYKCWKGWNGEKMKRTMTMTLIIVMLLTLCGCGSGQEKEIIKGFQKTLLRSDTLTVKDVWVLDGSVRTKEEMEGDKGYYSDVSAWEQEYAEKTRECHFVLIHCTYEDAGGIMTENYALYDKESDKYTTYSMSDIDAIGKTYAYLVTSEEQFAYDVARDSLEYYDYAKIVKTWTESKVDSINKAIK